MKTLTIALYNLLVLTAWVYVVFVLGFSGWWTIAFFAFLRSGD